jgi:hypothetical protein
VANDRSGELPAPPVGGAAAAAVVLTTAKAWTGYAPADVRDAFLDSIDQQDGARAAAMARHLLRCGNPLPSVTCAALGVACGSSYGVGAAAVLSRTAVD